MKTDDKSIVYGGLFMNDDKNDVIGQIERLEKLAKKNLLEENSLRTRLVKIDNSKKFIIGSAVLSYIKKNNRHAQALLEIIENEVKNETELNKIDDVIGWLKESSTL